MNNFRVDNSYIVCKIIFPEILRKVKILDITRLTILYIDLDSKYNSETRVLLKDFNNTWKIVEIIDK